MELQDAIRNRRSIRSFLTKSVSEDLLKEIVEDARWSPSWGNTQAWEVVVAIGEPLEEFKKRNMEAIQSGKPHNPDITMPEKWPDINMGRYKNLGKSVLGAAGIARRDQAARMQHFITMFGLFDAPALLLLLTDKSIELEYSMLDVGLFLQSFCLSAHDRGLGTCILACTVMCPGVARSVFSIPDTKRLVMGAAIGWPDPDAPVNNFERERGELGEFVRMIR